MTRLMMMMNATHSPTGFFVIFTLYSIRKSHQSRREIGFILIKKLVQYSWGRWGGAIHSDHYRVVRLITSISVRRKHVNHRKSHHGQTRRKSRLRAVQTCRPQAVKSVHQAIATAAYQVHPYVHSWLGEGRRCTKGCCQCVLLRPPPHFAFPGNNEYLRAKQDSGADLRKSFTLTTSAL